MLRSKSKDAYLVEQAKAITLGNSYTTTIHAINSCVLKLSKLTKAGKVWRGIKDAKLPKSFWVANAMGVRGGIEYGFSSTTTDKRQAVHYAGGDARKDGDASSLFEMQMGMVDRGADLAWLSQVRSERARFIPCNHPRSLPPYSLRVSLRVTELARGSRSTRTSGRCCCRR